MIYLINNKYYVNISPSIYVEVEITEDGKVTPTKNKIEVSEGTYIQKVKIDKVPKKSNKENNKETSIKQKYSRRKR